MGLIYMNGFGWSDTSLHHMTQFQTAGNGTITTNGGRFGGKALQITGDGDWGRKVNAFPDTAELYILTYWSGTRLDNTIGIFSLIDSLAYQATLSCDSGGILRARSGDRAGTILATSVAEPLQVETGRIYRIELHIVIHNTTGVFECKVDGVTVISVSGVNTRAGSSNNYANGFFIGTHGGTATQRQTDIHIADTSGSVDNTWLGDRRIYTLRPNGAGDSAQFTPSAGSNWQNVDDTGTPDGDTTRNTGVTVGHKDLFAMEDLAVTTGLVKGIQPLAYAQKTDAGTCDLSLLVKGGGTETESAQTALSSSAYSWVTGPLTSINPATGVAWTPTEINAIQVGYKRAA